MKQLNLEENRAGFRTQLGTQLRNERTGQVMLCVTYWLITSAL